MTTRRHKTQTQYKFFELNLKQNKCKAIKHFAKEQNLVLDKICLNMKKCIKRVSGYVQLSDPQLYINIPVSPFSAAIPSFHSQSTL